VNQTNAFRLEKKVSEKKLAARNERIRGLEVLLANAQEKQQQQASSHDEEISKYKRLVEDFQAKLVTATNSRSRASSLTTGHARIAKPIRGGGGRRKLTASSNMTMDEETNAYLRQQAQAVDDDDMEDGDNNYTGGGSSMEHDIEGLKKKRSASSPKQVEQQERSGSNSNGASTPITRPDRRTSGGGGGFLSGIFSRGKPPTPEPHIISKGGESPYPKSEVNGMAKKNSEDSPYKG